ncbi:MAG TPA: AAA family ATPase [bacterium]|nr:AAA family ATPase [bacterium]
MSNPPKIYTFSSLKRLVERLRSDLIDLDFVLIFAYNGTGKTRLSMAFKDAGKKSIISDITDETGSTLTSQSEEKITVEEMKGDTLYYNAYTEDLFHWDNDLDDDTERIIKINSDSKFFSGFKELALEEKIFRYLERYADFNFKIDYEKWTITFSKAEKNNIKISRGEENIFKWCIYLALCELAIDGAEAYSWVKFLYIDDPISSLDDNNAIAVACDLTNLLEKGRGKIKPIISSHHGLFFNVMCNEMKKVHTLKHKKYFLHRPNKSESFTLRATDETPFFHHIATLSELQRANESGKLYTYHFNMLRSIMEKTASFFGYSDFSNCIHGIIDETLFARALNLLSHGKYSVFEPHEMVEDTKELFGSIFNSFIEKYKFNLPDIIGT